MSFPDLTAIYPMMAVMLIAMVVLIVDLFLPKDRKIVVVAISLIGLLWSGVMMFNLAGVGATSFDRIVVADEFSLTLQFILLVIALVGILLSVKYVETKGINHGEYYALLLFSTSGAMLMASSVELITIFVGLEVLSISLYILAGFARTEARSEESAMKYFLLGAFSSGFFLYGIALVYGGLGTTRLDDITLIAAAVMKTPYVAAGLGMLIVGLGFKTGLVPFHNWTPDVYEGAPTSVTAFMSAAAKAAAFAAFIRIAGAFLPVSYVFHDLLWIVAAITMLVGNIVAVQQTNIKRMLAYSSVAHAGYILVGLLAANPEGRSAVVFYLLAYTFMNLGAFGVLILLARRGQELQTLDDLKGLARRSPAVGAVMAVFMLSLGGVPPMVGFMGKLYLFLAAIHAHLYGLAYLGLLASVVGVFYYLRVIWSMYFETPVREFPENPWRFAPFASTGLVICVAATMVFGVVPGPMYDMSNYAGNSILVVTANLHHEHAAPAHVHRRHPLVAALPRHQG